MGFEDERAGDSILLHNSVKTNEQYLVNATLHRGADVDFFCPEERRPMRTPLRVACSHANIHMIRVLLKNKAQVFAHTSTDKWSALHSAAHAGHDHVARLLLKEVEDLHENVCHEGFSLLHILAECLNGRLQDHGAELFSWVFRHMPSINVNAKSRRHGYLDWTPLHIVCARGWTKAAAVLIRNRAEVTATTGEFHVRSPSINLLSQGDTGAEVADLDLDYDRVEPHWLDGGLLPIHLAAFGGHLRAVQMLLKNGQPINARTRDHRWTPLMFAVWSGSVKLVAEICRVGGRKVINNVDRRACGSEWTPLALAVVHGCPEMVQTLVAYGADPLTRFSFFDFPGQPFVDHMAPVLLDAHDNRWSGPDSRISLLHLAVLRGDLRILKIVLDFVRTAHFSPVRSAANRPSLERAIPWQDIRTPNNVGSCRQQPGSKKDGIVTNDIADMMKSSVVVQDRARARLQNSPVMEGQDCDPVAFCTANGWSPAVLAMMLHTVDPMRQVTIEFLEDHPHPDRMENTRADIFLELLCTGRSLLEDRADSAAPAVPQRFPDVSETLVCRVIDEFARLCKVHVHTLEAPPMQSNIEVSRIEKTLRNVCNATLCMACRFNRMQVVRHLLELGQCDVRCPEVKPVECRPLHVATACGFGYLAQMLLEYRADPLEGDERAEMPVFKLARCYSQQVSELQARVAELEAQLAEIDDDDQQFCSGNAVHTLVPHSTLRRASDISPQGLPVGARIDSVLHDSRM